MESLHYKAGYIAAKHGEFRAAPANLKIVTPQWKEWYQGFDTATRDGNNPQLNASFSLRAPSTIHKVTL